MRLNASITDRCAWLREVVADVKALELQLLPGGRRKETFHRIETKLDHSTYWSSPLAREDVEWLTASINAALDLLAEGFYFDPTKGFCNDSV